MMRSPGRINAAETSFLEQAEQIRVPIIHQAVEARIVGKKNGNNQR